MLNTPPTSAPTRPSSQQPQRLVERGLHDTVVQHSPYGASRNTTYGWGTPFQPLMPATVPGQPRLHIGISSLNGVPALGRADRSMRHLLWQYRQKFSCLEHCNPYHNVGDAKTWQSWADMVQDSSIGSIGGSSSSGGGTSGAGRAEGEEPATSPHVLTVDPSRFIYTVKANNFLTHVKQLHVDDEVVAHVRVFFRERCLLLEPHLGPVLVQLPPSFAYSAVNMQRLTGLYELLSREHVSLCERVTSSGSPASTSDSVDAPPQQARPVRTQRRLRIAVEFRNRTWFREETFALLRSFRWALVVAHHHDDSTFAQVVDTDAGFLYVRLHGSLGRNVGDYGPLAMKLWAEEFVEYLYPSQSRASGASAAAAAEREVFVFLNNSDSHVGHATSSVVDATCLAEQARRLLEGAVSLPQPTTSAAVAHRTAPAPAPLSPPVTSASLPSSSPEARPRVSLVRDPPEGEEEELRDAPAKRRRTTSPRGSGTRDDELVIE